MTLAELVAKRDALMAARLSGQRVVELDGARIEYKSDAEMLAALNAADAAIAQAAGVTRVTDIRFSTSKGIC